MSPCQLYVLHCMEAVCATDMLPHNVASRPAVIRVRERGVRIMLLLFSNCGHGPHRNFACATGTVPAALLVLASTDIELVAAKGVAAPSTGAPEVRHFSQTSGNGGHHGFPS